MLSSGEGKEKRRFEMNTNGFHGDTFSGGFGDFYTAKKRNPALESTAWKETPFSGSNQFYKQEPDYAFYPHHKFKVNIDRHNSREGCRRKLS